MESDQLDINKNEYTIKSYESDEEQCYIRAIITNKDGNDLSINVNIKPPISNIIELVINQLPMDCIIILRKLYDNTIKFQIGLYEKLDDSVLCYITPQARELDKKIKKEIEQIIKYNKLNKYLTEENCEKLRLFSKNSLFPLEEWCCIDERLKNDLIYYYCLYCYAIDKKGINMSQLEFETYLNNHPLKEISGIEEYDKLIKDINTEGVENPEQYNFIRITDDLLLLPLYKYNYIPTITDLLLLKETSDGNKRYCNIQIEIFYKDPKKRSLKSIVDISELIKKGELKLEEWMRILSEIRIQSHEYYKIVFGLQDIKSELSLNHEEVISGFDKDIYICTREHPKNKCLVFLARYYPDFFGQSITSNEYISEIDLYTLSEYSRLNILDLLTINIISRKKDVPVYYYNQDISKLFKNGILRYINRDKAYQMSEEFNTANLKDPFINKLIIKRTPIEKSKIKTTIIDKKETSTKENDEIKWEKTNYLPIEKKEETFKNFKTKRYSIIKKTESNPIIGGKWIKYEPENQLTERVKTISKNKINNNGKLVDIDKSSLIIKIKEITWDGSITFFDCNVRIYGNQKIGEIVKNFVLYIIPHKIGILDVNNILINMKKLFENTFIYNVEYDLYLHEIRDEVIITESVSNINYLEEELYDNNDLDDGMINNSMYIEPKQKKDVKRDHIMLRIDNTIEKKIQEGIIFNTNGLKEVFTIDNMYNGIERDIYTEKLIKNKNYPIKLIMAGIFNFIRYFTVYNKYDKNIEILNPEEVTKEMKKKNIYPFPNHDEEKERIIDTLDAEKEIIIDEIHNEIDNEKDNEKDKLVDELIDDIKIERKKQYHAQAVCLISQDNYSNFEIEEDVETLKEGIGLKTIIKKLIDTGIVKNNFFRFVFYIFPWREEKLFNISGLRTTDLEYIIELFNNCKKAGIKILNDNGINANVNNVSLFCHYPAGHEGLHIQFIYNNIICTNTSKMICNKEKINGNRYLGNTIRAYTEQEIINLLKLKNIEYFEKSIKYVYYYIPRYISILEAIEKKQNQLNNINKIIGGGNINNFIYTNFINYINKYIVYEKLFKIYNLNHINIDFEIKKIYKKIRNEDVLDNYKKSCIFPSTNHTNINNFYKSLHREYISISKMQYYINIIENLTFKKFNNIMFITKTDIDFNNIKINHFYIDDNLKFINYEEKYNMLYDFIRISNHSNEAEVLKNNCDTIIYFKKNIVTLIWALKHLNKDGYISLLTRETLTVPNYDLLLLLNQFCTVKIYYSLLTHNGLMVPLNLLLNNFNNIIILINHLEKILTFDIDKNTGFLNIKKIINGDIDKFDKITLKPSLFLYNRTNEYRNCFKNKDGEYEKMPVEIEYLIIKKVIILLSKTYVPKPENINYINTLLELKKVKIGNKSIKLNNNQLEESTLLYKIIKKAKAKKILEIGMDYGIYSVYILQSLKYLNYKYNEGDNIFKLVSIDQSQMTYWKGLGIENIKKAHLLENHKLKQENTFFLLPKLIKLKKTYDIIFINGWITIDYMIDDLNKAFHSIEKKYFTTMDYILNDLLNVYHLTKINGYIIINNILNPGISTVLEYFERNYPFLKKIDTEVKSMAVYIKLDKDDESHDMF